MFDFLMLVINSIYIGHVLNKEKSMGKEHDEHVEKLNGEESRIRSLYFDKKFSDMYKNDWRQIDSECSIVTKNMEFLENLYSIKAKFKPEINQEIGRRVSDLTHAYFGKLDPRIEIRLEYYFSESNLVPPQTHAIFFDKWLKLMRANNFNEELIVMTTGNTDSPNKIICFKNLANNVLYNYVCTLDEYIAKYK